LWEIEPERDAGRRTQVSTGHGHIITSIAFHPSGKLLASGSLDRTCGVWDVRRVPSTGELRCERRATLLNDWCAPSLHNGVWSVAYSPDGRCLAAGYGNGDIALWDTEQHTLIRLLRGHEDWVRSLAFHPTGRYLASGSNDATVRLWDWQTGELCRVFAGHSDWVMAVAFHPTGICLASAGHDRTIRIWQPDQDTPVQSLRGHSNGILTLAFSPDGQTLVSGSQDETMKLWAVGSPADECVRTIRAPGPYAGMNITGATGISAAQRGALRALGAVEK